MSADAFQPEFPPAPDSWPRLAPSSKDGTSLSRGAGHAGARPALRLIGGEGVGLGGAAAAALAERRRAIERENRASSVLDPEDARGIVATRVDEALEGGRAAILRPESRRRIVTLATRLGLRPFDANLIIAIVQDGARRGVRCHDRELHAMLRLIDAPRPRRMSIGTWPQRGGGQRGASERPAVERWMFLIRVIAAALLGVLWGGAMVAWVVGLF